MSALPGAPLIRKATADNAARVSAIARAAYKKFIPRMGRKPPPMLADFAAQIAGGFGVVIVDASGPAGYPIGWPEADVFFIDNIAIDPERQGEGLGRRLLEYAVAQAARLNLPAVRLYTNTAMTENVSIYSQFGFIETHSAVENGFHRVHMRLIL